MEETPEKYRLHLVDPLGIETRTTRRSLMISSLVAFALVKGGLMPTKVSVFGIELTQVERSSLLILLSLILLYFLVLFAMSAAADVMMWRLAIRSGWLKERLDDEKKFICEIHNPDRSQKVMASDKFEIIWERNLDGPRRSKQRLDMSKGEYIIMDKQAGSLTSKAKNIGIIRAVVDVVVPFFFSVYTLIAIGLQFL